MIGYQAPPLVGAISCAGSGAEWTYVCSGEGSQVRRAAAEGSAGTKPALRQAKGRVCL